MASRYLERGGARVAMYGTNVVFGFMCRSRVNVDLGVGFGGFYGVPTQYKSYSADDAFKCAK